VADVEGEIEDIDGVIRVTRIRVKYRVAIPAELKGKAEHALAIYAESCPAYMSVKGCIEVDASAEFVDA